MEEAVKTVLAEFEKRAETERRLMEELPWEEFAARRDEFLLAVGPAAGTLLNLLVKEAGSKTIVEIGTSYGYSTVWLAEAARATGGKVITLEIHAHKIEAARAAVSRTGLEPWVDFRPGDALDTLRDIEDGIDFVLLDLWKELYIPCFDLFYPQLRSNALIAADNILFPQATLPQAEQYRKHIRRMADIESVLLPVGSGIELSRYVGPAV